MAASKEPTTPDDLTTTVNPRVLNDTLLTNAKPLQINPHFQSDIADDDFTRAHINADTDSGDGAIHHTLGHAGGGATFEHSHGESVHFEDIVNGTSPAPTYGSGGYARVSWKKMDKNLVWMALNVRFGAGATWPSGAGISFGSTGWFVAHKILPTSQQIMLPAYLFIGTQHRLGAVVGDDFNWTLSVYQYKGDALGEVTQYSSPLINAGDYITASGIYRYA